MDNSVFERQSSIYHHFFMNAFDYNYWLGCIKMGIYCPKPPKKNKIHQILSMSASVGQLIT